MNAARAVLGKDVLAADKTTVISVPPVRATCVLEHLGTGVESGCLGPRTRQILAVYFKALLDHGTLESSILRRNACREPFLEQPDVLGTDAAAAANEPRAHT